MVGIYSGLKLHLRTQYNVFSCGGIGQKQLFVCISKEYTSQKPAALRQLNAWTRRIRMTS